TSAHRYFLLQPLSVTEALRPELLYLMPLCKRKASGQHKTLQPQVFLVRRHRHWPITEFAGNQACQLFQPLLLFHSTETVLQQRLIQLLLFQLMSDITWTITTMAACCHKGFGKTNIAEQLFSFQLVENLIEDCLEVC